MSMNPSCQQCGEEDAEVVLCTSCSRAEVTRLTDLLASQRAEYETALALATDTVRDLTAEADALKAEVSVLESDCEDGSCRACVKCCDSAIAALAAEKAAHASARQSNLDACESALDWKARAERAEAQLATMREALTGLLAAHRMDPSDPRVFFEVARATAILAALSASAPTEPRADLKCDECNSRRLSRFLVLRCEECGFSDSTPSEVTK